MLQQALQKLQVEITAADKDDDVSRGIGAFLIDHIRANQDDASKIMTEGKSLSGCVKAMADEASKMKKTGNMVRITDAQGFAMALKYYGVAVAAPVGAPASTNFEVNFDDL